MANTITLFLTSDDPNGLRTAHIDNWNGVAIAAPRTELSSLFQRPELKKGNSVYILFGGDYAGIKSTLLLPLSILSVNR